MLTRIAALYRDLRTPEEDLEPCQTSMELFRKNR